MGIQYCPGGQEKSIHHPEYEAVATIKTPKRENHS